MVPTLAASVTAGEPSAADPLAEIRLLAGRSPRQALAALEALRAQPRVREQAAQWLAVEALACRVQNDFDGRLAHDAADAALAVAGTPPAAARAAWMRLRICRAAARLELDGDNATLQSLDTLIAEAEEADEPVVQALARLERGVARSRRGWYEIGQQDLLDACQALDRPGAEADHEYGLGHLAIHHRRVGDTAEAHRLLVRLREAARARGASYDDAIYAFAQAQTHDEAGDRMPAAAAYREAAAAFERQGDRRGLAYAEHGLAVSLIETGDGTQALPHLDKALAAFDPAADPNLHEKILFERAHALVLAGRAAEARKELDRIGAAVQARGEEPLVEAWHRVDGQVHAALGDWQAAYASAQRAREIALRLNRLRQSEQSARLRAQFHRARDAEELLALRRVNEREQHRRQTEAAAAALASVLLVAALVLAFRKIRQARRMQRLAATDELTGLPNRRALVATLDTALERAADDRGRVALLMIDVDHFKRINDTRGHAVGDEVLRHLARVLGASLRDGDRLGRLGGEEFLAVLPATSPADAHQVAERMRAQVAATPLLGAAGEVRFTISVGVAASQQGEPASALMARADAALYSAKHAGRNSVQVDDTPHGAADAA